MAIPDFQSIMLPLLEIAGDGKEHNIREATIQLGKYFKLSDEEQAVLLSSGQQPLFYNRVGWAKAYLKKAGLLDGPRRGFFKITSEGSKVLRSKPEIIDKNFLEKFPGYIEFRKRPRIENQTNGKAESEVELTPEEALEDAYQKIRDDLATELLESVLRSSPGFFEKLVVELLSNMGYGGSRREAARAVGQSGDEGIDGIIDEDRLGLDSIYIQAKKWKDENHVGRPEIQKFIGALHGQRAKKGIFITTSRFTEDAKNYVKNIDTKVVLIDGKRLSDLMIDYGVGVVNRTKYEIKGIDTEYFESA
ncbi:MAG: restriction endonuclease [Chloroflexi bacterium HGW-Chloroflexi-2]|jgi:restriction system protein|nr:MAG: restriction endonuclease [Chloroflexi bacterium HGW-Chloroflexi-2]